MKILSLEDIDRWHRQLETGYCHDVYFSPQYAQTFNSIDSGEPLLFVYKKNDNFFIYPFRLRKLPQIEQFCNYSEWFDISSDYGYGGPFVYNANNSIEEFIEHALCSFDSFCADQRIVSEFCRFHPLFQNAKYMSNKYHPVFCNHTVWVDLTLSEQDCLKQIRQGYRYDIRQAEKQGIEIEISDRVEDIDIFYELYVQTMHDVGASRYYFFSKEFFRAIFQYLAGHSLVFHANYKGKAIAAAIYIWGKEFLHYHFGAFDRNFSNKNANKLILYNAIKWGREQGLKKFHLGGGVGGTDSDSLMRFKSGFSKLRADFYIAKRIHNYDIYRKLCSAIGVNPETATFFPAYRAR